MVLCGGEMFAKRSDRRRHGPSDQKCGP